MKISIMVVCLNAGDALNETVASIRSQKDADYEIIVKDGGSKDGCTEKLPTDPRIRLVTQKDSGIYDAMNQAVQYATGEVAMYMNCGDRFYNDTVLRDIIQNIGRFGPTAEKRVFYGDCYTANRDYILHYPDVFDDYMCYTMVLCHQATVYPTSLLRKRSFAAGYKMAADFEFYTYAHKNGYNLTHLPIVIAWYEGNGASEKQVNRKLALEERERAIKTHFSEADYKKVKKKAFLHGVGIKNFLVKQDWLYPLYSRLAKVYYRCSTKK